MSRKTVEFESIASCGTASLANTSFQSNAYCVDVNSFEQTKSKIGLDLGFRVQWNATKFHFVFIMTTHYPHDYTYVL